MSLTIIAMTGILVGILCLMVGFFMEGTDSRPLTMPREKTGKSMKKKMVVPKRKAA